ncbi:MAG: TolC family protein [Acidobacteria bacterium]|nr:TolC family protein [Acidobacteriota bacterium]MCI0722740.1 TolC family protein [Acidobacteriota bacterium]
MIRHGRYAVDKLAHRWVAFALALTLTFGQVPSVFGQSVFPLPGWFRDNVKRPKTVDQEKSASDFLNSLMKDGKLGLTEADAIRLVLENNLDVVADRYDPWLAQYDIDRGYALFDPKLSFTLAAGRNTIPQSNTVTSGVAALRNLNESANFTFSQLFQTGTRYSIAYNNFRQSSNNLRNLLNPFLSSSLTATVSQPLLRDFGFLPNRRPILIARNNKDISNYVFAQRLIALVNQVQTLYWNMVFAREDIKVKQRSLDLATKTNEDNKRQVEIGTLAPIEVVKSESEIANRKEELIRAQFLLEQYDDQMKKYVSSFSDLSKITAAIDPTDKTLLPSDFKDFDLAQAVSYAIEARPEIKQLKKDLENQEINVRYFRNQLLPSVNLDLTYGTSALAGQNRIFLSDGTFTLGPSSGWNDNISTLFGRDFASYSAAVTVEIPITNRAGKADFARANFSKYQAEKRLSALEQQIALEVRNAHTELEMNRARIEAAQKSRELAERNLDAEQKKFQLGTSTIRFVLEEQRNLAIAQSNEVRALVDFTKAKNNLDRAVGKTLEVQSIRVEDALSGNLDNQPKRIPGSANQARANP